MLKKKKKNAKNEKRCPGRRKGVPMGRVGSGEDIAGPAVFLACEELRYTTGSVLGADGGQAVGYFPTVPGRRFSGGRID